MKKSLLVASLGLAVAGCKTADGALDPAELPAAEYDRQYQASLNILDYEGDANFTLSGGSLPDGLDLDAVGRVSGTPTWAGHFEFDVLVTGMSKYEDFVETVTLEVSVAHLPDAFVGYEPDQLNNMIDVQYRPGVTYMDNVWVRVAGTGEEQFTWTLEDPGIYLPGDDGEADCGFGDDVRIGDLEPETLEVAFGEWQAAREPNTYPNDGYPSVHEPEGDDPVWDDASMSFTAGVDTGEGTLTFGHPDVANTCRRPAQVVPPDWCVNGQSTGPQEGICE